MRTLIVLMLLGLGACTTGSQDRPAIALPQEATTKAASSVDTWIASRGVQIPVTITLPATNGVPMPLVLLIHGHGGTRHEAGGFTGVAEALTAAGIATIRMDFPGCGDSREPWTKNYLSNMQADVVAAYQHMLRFAPIDANAIGALGFSMGGRVALHSLEEIPVTALGLWAPSTGDGVSNLSQTIRAEAGYMALRAKAQRDGFAPFTTSWGQDQQLSLSWFEQLEASMPNQMLAEFGGHLLLLYGDKDIVIPPRLVLASHAAAVNAASRSLQLLEGADHGLGLFDDPSDRSQRLIAMTAAFFIERLTP